MKITLCGSIACYPEMEQVRIRLENSGHEVKMPPHEVSDENGNMIPVLEYYSRRKQASEDEAWIWERKAEAIQWHFEKVTWSEAILITNYDKNGIAGYIGGNTLMEMGIAFFLKKPIYLLNQIPEVSYKEEILGMKPTVLHGDLHAIITP